jgi:hypothetical protein
MALANPTSLMGGCGAAHRQGASAGVPAAPASGGGGGGGSCSNLRSCRALLGRARAQLLQAHSAAWPHPLQPVQLPAPDGRAGRPRWAAAPDGCAGRPARWLRGRACRRRTARAVPSGPTCCRVPRFLIFRARQASERRNHSDAVAHSSLQRRRVGCAAGQPQGGAAGGRVRGGGSAGLQPARQRAPCWRTRTRLTLGAAPPAKVQLSHRRARRLPGRPRGHELHQARKLLDRHLVREGPAGGARGCGVRRAAGAVREPPVREARRWPRKLLARSVQARIRLAHP